MSLTENGLPPPAAQNTAGIDWAKDDYAVLSWTPPASRWSG
jgi:hypothetical protein